MGMIEVSIDIQAPAEKVFALFTELDKSADRIDGIKKLELLTPGPIGKGTQFRETRVMLGKEATEEMEITDFQPNESYRVDSESGGARYTTRYSFSEQGDSTRVTMQFEGQPKTFAAKLLSPAFLMMAKTVRKCLQDDLECLKKFAESADS